MEMLANFAGRYGGKHMGKEIRDEVVKEMLESCERHIKKYGFRSRTVAELDKLTKSKR